ncbi:MAG: hypothetical protein HY014_15375 [Acidobacteria bacterium]|nr:hypothetical protein [Acidobacteriota bacterium]MBI3489538.1 hypothetical protein [Acidobacteriota bacterium]
MSGLNSRAGSQALLMAGLGLAFGGAALWAGLGEGSVALWGFGGACLLQVAPALSLRWRIAQGLGNSGLDRERRILRISSFLQRFLALGLAMASVSALLGERAPQTTSATQGAALLAVLAFAPLWFAKRSFGPAHPAFQQEADRSLLLLALAVLLLAATVLGRWFFWADAAAGLAQALGLFFAGQALAKATSLPAFRGGCGGSCSCG